MSGSRSVLVTGGAGFIGSHLVDLLMLDPDTRVTVLDRLSTGGSRANLEDHDGDARFTFVQGDVRDAATVGPLVENAEAVVHAAAESHVDRSVDAPLDFVGTNVLGTATVLDACRETSTRMLMLSTDEVYGQGDPDGGSFTETDALRPRSAARTQSRTWRNSRRSRPSAYTGTGRPSSAASAYVGPTRSICRGPYAFVPRTTVTGTP